jgi:hypothetical protein
MAREFNVPPEAMLAAIETGAPLTLQQLPEDLEDKWGFTLRTPVEVTVEQKNDNMYEVTFSLGELYRTNKQLFQTTKMIPGQVVQYEGPVPEKDSIEMSMNQLMQAWQGKAFAGAGAMGGAPPMMGGMGAPPMGGGMGAPPMGGPPIGGLAAMRRV